MWRPECFVISILCFNWILFNLCFAQSLFHIPLDLGPALHTLANTTGIERIQKRHQANESNFTELSNKIDGEPGQGYYFTIEIGTPPQKLNVLIDTGSSDLAVAGISFPEVDTYFDSMKSSTYKSWGYVVEVNYVVGSWSGLLGSDLITFPGLALGSNTSLSATDKMSPTRTQFTRITTNNDFFISQADWQGIAGLAFDNLLKGGKTNFFTAIAKHFNISDAFSVAFCRLSNINNSTNQNMSETMPSELGKKGTFIAGGVDSRFFTGPLVYTNLRKKWYFEVVLTNITVNDKPVIADCKELNMEKAIVDTGTTLIHLPHRVFSGLKSLISQHLRTFDEDSSIPTGESFWRRDSQICLSTGSMQRPSDGRPYSYFPEVRFSLMADANSTVELALSPQQYLAYVGIQSNGFSFQHCYLFQFQSVDADTVLGSTFSEGFYTLFDKDNGRIGWAQSKCNSYTSNPSVPVSRVVQSSSPWAPLSAELDSNFAINSPLDCAYVRSADGSRKRLDDLSLGMMIVLGVLTIMIVLPMMIMFAIMHYRVLKHDRLESNFSTTQFRNQSKMTCEDDENISLQAVMSESTLQDNLLK